MSTENNNQGGAAPEPQAAQAAPAPVQTESSPAQSVEDILKFDPFGGNSELDTSGVETPKGNVPAAEGSEPVAPQPAPAAAPNVPAPNPEADELKKQIGEMKTLLETMKQTQVPASAEPAAPVDDLPAYNFNIPDEIYQRLASEDPAEFRQGVGALTCGLARSIHRTVRDEVIQKIVPQVISQAQQQTVQGIARTQEQNHIRTDFYGKFKELDKPEYHPIVALVAQQVSEELGNPGYTEAFREKLGQRLQVMFNLVKPQQPPVQPATFGSSPARQQVSPEMKNEQEIRDVIFG